MSVADVVVAGWLWRVSGWEVRMVVECVGVEGVRAGASHAAGGRQAR